MLKDTISIILLSSAIFNLCYAEPSKQEILQTGLEHQQESFGNLEHKDIGDAVQLQWSDLPHKHAAQTLIMDNGIRIDYGEIVYMGGDLFGDAGCSVSHSTEQSADHCFQRQFDHLYRMNDPYMCKSPISRVPVYRSYFHELAQSIQQANAEGMSAADYYHVNNIELSNQLNRMSCGGSVISPLFPFGQYITLAEINFDHFAPDAIKAYRVGHKSALALAKQAHDNYLTGDRHSAERLLSEAYAQNAFANHYLSDAFASGHMRTPRYLIDKQLFLPKALKLLVANLMHDEDNREGLYVHNRRGYSWKAYGDGMLQEAYAADHRRLVIQAMQESADAIFKTFHTGEIPTNYDELNLTPVYNDINNKQNHQPLFIVRDGKVLKRKKNFDIHNDQYTQWWSGMVTLIDFMIHNKLV